MKKILFLLSFLIASFSYAQLTDAQISAKIGAATKVITNTYDVELQNVNENLTAAITANGAVEKTSHTQAVADLVDGDRYILPNIGLYIVDSGATDGYRVIQRFGYKFQYPFAPTPVSSDRLNFLKDIEVYNYTGEEPLFIYNVWRGYDVSGTLTWKLLLRSYNETTGVSTNICQATLASYTEASADANGHIYGVIESNSDLSGDGVTFKAYVDWSAYTTGSQNFATYEEAAISEATWVDVENFGETRIENRINSTEASITSIQGELTTTQSSIGTIQTDIADVQTDINELKNTVIETYTYDDLTPNTFWNLSGTTVANTPVDYTTSTSYVSSSPEISVKAGDLVTISSKGVGSNALTYAITDTGRNILSSSSDDTTLTPVEIEITQNGIVFVNLNPSDYEGFFVSVTTSKESYDLNLINESNKTFASNTLRKKQYRNQPVKADYVLFLGYGQSLSVGGASTALTTTVYDSNKMIGTNIHYPYSNSTTTLTGLANSSVEHIVVPIVNDLKRYYNYSHDTDRTFVATSCGQGGTSIEWLSKDCPANSGEYFQRIIDAFTDLKAIADAEGKTVVLGGTFFLQGEANSTGRDLGNWEGDGDADSTKEGYKGYLTQLITDIEDQAFTIFTDQVEKPAFFIYQTQMDYSSITANIAMAQTEVANENDNVYMFSPVYYAKTGDDTLHPTANGYRWVAEQAAIKARNVLFSKNNTTPLQPYSIKKLDSTKILINYLSDSYPLTVNTSTIDNSYSEYGFKVYDDVDAELTIDGVTVGESYVLIELNSAITTDIKVCYANSNSTDGKGNITDSFSERAFNTFVDQSGDTYEDTFIPSFESSSILGEEYPLPNWSIAFYYEIPLEIEELKIIE